MRYRERRAAAASNGIQTLINAILGLALVLAFCALAWLTFARP